MAKIDNYALKLWDLEGGFCNHPNDKGGPTNRGVTLATYKEYCHEMGKPDPTIETLRNLGFSEYCNILRWHSWDTWQADKINSQQVAEILVDWVYNSGAWGVKKPQTFLGLKPDGLVGPKTLKAVNDYDPRLLFTHIKSMRKEFYLNIVKANPSQKVFLKGWMNRVDSFNYV